MSAADEARAEASERTFPFSPTAALAFKMGWDACAEWRSRGPEVGELTAQLQAAQAIIAEAKVVDNFDIQRRYWDMLAILSRSDTSAHDAAILAAKAEGWDEGYWQGINGHTGPGNPHRDSGSAPPRAASIEQKEADRG